MAAYSVNRRTATIRAQQPLDVIVEIGDHSRIEPQTAGWRSRRVVPRLLARATGSSRCCPYIKMKARLQSSSSFSSEIFSSYSRCISFCVSRRNRACALTFCRAFVRSRETPEACSLARSMQERASSRDCSADSCSSTVREGSSLARLANARNLSMSPCSLPYKIPGPFRARWRACAGGCNI